MVTRRMPGSGASDRADGSSVRVWDLPTRLFHWLLVILVSVNLYTGFLGGLREMNLHMQSGYAILALVLFRLLWGVIGSARSRFGDFVRGPRAVLAYARGLMRGQGSESVGHNPLGGWSVMALLLVLAVQATTGLFSNDDIFTEGPLAKLVSKATSDMLTSVHDAGVRVLIALIVLHLAAVAFYWLAKGQNLIRPMITGRKRPGEAPVAADQPFAPLWRAGLATAVAAAAVWAIVSL